VSGSARVLHAGAEIFPFIKTGGLADVLGALPSALRAEGLDVRLLLPGYPALREPLQEASVVCSLGPAFGAARIEVLLGRLPGLDLPVYVIDAPSLYGRAGNPYTDARGQAWHDNPQRFGLLGWVAAHLGLGGIDRDWRPQIVHAHDWHAGLAPAHLALHPQPGCRSVITVHNLAFLGAFAPHDVAGLLLPPDSFAPDGVEFHGEGSMLKAALHYADAITTVSPTYAREIRTPEFGCGLDGVIVHRAARLHGILNGVDEAVWSPATDAHIAARYDAARLDGKARCKAALQKELGLASRADAPLIGVVSRLTSQKGLDLLLQAMPALMHDGAQLAVLGSGDAALEQGLRALAARAPQQVAMATGYDEARAHRIIAGADLIAVPSRFEPCGLTQLYGLRYGTLPLVRRVGGLADTVVDASDAAVSAGTATGFAFDEASTPALLGAARRALQAYRKPPHWRALMQTAMRQDFSWRRAAGAYAALYGQLLSADSTVAPRAS
jgi:starch synthase